MGETEAFGLGRQLAGLPNQERLAQGDLAKDDLAKDDLDRAIRDQPHRAVQGNPTQDTLRKLGASLRAVLTFATADGRPISI